MAETGETVGCGRTFIMNTTHSFFVTKMSLNTFLHIPIVKDDTMRLVCVIINIFLAGSIFRLF